MTKLGMRFLIHWILNTLNFYIHGCHAQIEHAIFNTCVFSIHGLGMPKLGMGFKKKHGFAQHGQHHLEHSLQHL